MASLQVIGMALLALACSIGSAQPSDVAAKVLDAKGRIYVYRYLAIQGKAVRPSIFVDEKDVARLQSGRGVVLALEPGQHILRSGDKQSQIVLDVKAGRAYYIRIDIAGGSWSWKAFANIGRLTLILPEQGVGEY